MQAVADILSQLGQWRPELVDELYQAALKVEQRGPQETRNAMLRADQHASWLAGLRCKIHDLVMQGIEVALKKRGYPSIEDLKAGKK
jgi:hypothetical protein